MTSSRITSPALPSFDPATNRALLLVIAFALHHAAGAAESGEEIVLRKVQVTESAEKAAGPVRGYVAKRSSSATRTDTPLNEVPQSISVISAEQIRDQGAQTMQEVLRYTAGVRAEMYGLDNRGDWFDLRGGSEGSTLLDGMRLPLTGYYGAVRNEPYAFERVEVLRGPSSVMAGQNGPGGVVNLVSKMPQADALREIKVQLGNYDHKQLALDLTGPLNADGSVLYRLVGLVRDSGTQIEHADDDRQYIAPSLTWLPNDATALTVYAQYQRDETGNTNGFFPIEGLRQPGPHGYIPSDTFIGEPDWDTYGGKRIRVGYQFEYQLSGNWSLKHDLRYDDVDGEYRTMYAAWWDGYQDPNQSFLNRIWYASNDRSRITNTDLLAIGKLQSGRIEHTILLGADGMWAANSRQSLEGDATPLNVYDPVYGTFPLPDLHFAPATKTDVRQIGFIAQDQMKIDNRWVIVPSLRRDFAKTDADADADSSNDAAWSSRLGVVYLADGGWSPYVSYSESFEAVTGGSYKPKRGKQYEAGVKWSPTGERLAVNVAAYHLKERNRLTANSADPLGPSIQKGEVTVKGFEIEAIASLAAWDVIANYTYTDAKTTASGDSADPTLGNQLVSIPKHAASAWAVHRFSLFDIGGFRAGAGVRYVGETGDGIDVTDTPSNTLFDALLSLDRGQWSYAINATNVFDKQYVATCLDRGDCWLGSRRKVIGSISYRF